MAPVAFMFSAIMVGMGIKRQRLLPIEALAMVLVLVSTIGLIGEGYFLGHEYGLEIGFWWFPF